MKSSSIFWMIPLLSILLTTACEVKNKRGDPVASGERGIDGLSCSILSQTAEGTELQCPTADGGKEKVLVRNGLDGKSCKIISQRPDGFDISCPDDSGNLQIVSVSNGQTGPAGSPGKSCELLGETNDGGYKISCPDKDGKDQTFVLNHGQNGSSCSVSSKTEAEIIIQCPEKDGKVQEYKLTNGAGCTIDHSDLRAASIKCGDSTNKLDLDYLINKRICDLQGKVYFAGQCRNFDISVFGKEKVSEPLLLRKACLIDRGCSEYFDPSSSENCATTKVASCENTPVKCVSALNLSVTYLGAAANCTAEESKVEGTKDSALQALADARVRYILNSEFKQEVCVLTLLQDENLYSELHRKHFRAAKGSQFVHHFTDDWGHHFQFVDPASQTLFWKTLPRNYATSDCKEANVFADQVSFQDVSFYKDRELKELACVIPKGTIGSAIVKNDGTIPFSFLADFRLIAGICPNTADQTLYVKDNFSPFIRFALKAWPSR